MAPPFSLAGMPARYDGNRAIVLQDRALHLVDTRMTARAQRRFELVVGDPDIRQSILQHMAIVDDQERSALNDRLEPSALEGAVANQAIQRHQRKRANQSTGKRVVSAVH